MPISTEICGGYQQGFEQSTYVLLSLEREDACPKLNSYRKSPEDLNDTTCQACFPTSSRTRDIFPGYKNGTVAFRVEVYPSSLTLRISSLFHALHIVS